MDAPITFVRTDWFYDSYRDFFHLAELAGFPTIKTSELDLTKPGIYITSPMNGEWRPMVDAQSNKVRNAHLILWNIERPSGSAGAIGKYAESCRDLLYGRYVDEVWVSDRRLAEETGLRFVVLGSHPGLGEPGDEKQYSFCHMSYEVPRRQTIYKHFNQGQVGPNCWPPARDDVLKKSRFALNVHQDNHPFQEPLRFALFAAYGLPILTETIYDAHPWGDDTMIFTPYEGLVGKLKMLLDEDYLRYKEIGLKARERMTTEFEFGKVVKEAVSQSVGDWRL